MKTSPPTAGITLDRPANLIALANLEAPANLEALAVVRLAHLGMLAQAIVAVGFVVAAADRSNDSRSLLGERTNDRHSHAGAFAVGKEARAGRLLAEFVRATFQAGKSTAFRADLGAGAGRQTDRESECDSRAESQKLPHQILPFMLCYANDRPVSRSRAAMTPARAGCRCN